MSQSDIINSRQIQWFPGHMTKTLRLMEKEIRLTPEAVRQIEEILTTGKTVEIAERHEKVIVWAVSSKKKYEQPIA
mgnify:FL=1